MCVPPTGSQAGPFHGWSPGRPGDTGWSLGVPKASPRPCPGHPSRGPPPYPPSTAGRSPGNLTLDGLFLELLTILFAFPMTSNVPRPGPHPRAVCPAAPPPPSCRPGGPLHTPVPAFACSPVSPVPWLLALEEVVRWRGRPGGLAFLWLLAGGGLPQPRVCTTSRLGEKVRLAMDPGPG